MANSKTIKRFKPHSNLDVVRRTPELEEGVRWLMNRAFQRVRYIDRINRAHELLLQEKDHAEIVVALKNEFFISETNANESILYATAIHRAVFFESMASDVRIHIAQKLNIANELTRAGNYEGAMKVLDYIFHNGGIKKNMRESIKNQKYNAIKELVSVMAKAGKD